MPVRQAGMLCCALLLAIAASAGDDIYGTPYCGRTNPCISQGWHCLAEIWMDRDALPAFYRLT